MVKSKNGWGDPRLKFMFEPIDLWALAAKYGGPYRHSREKIRQIVASRARNRKRRFAEAVERRRRESTHGPIKVKNRLAVFRVMEPGHWYAMRDITELSGVEKCSLCYVLPRMREAGFLERAKNPERQPAPASGARGSNDPRWLWRLSEAGERERAAWLAAGAPAEVIQPRQGSAPAPLRFSSSREEHGRDSGCGET